MRWARAWGLTCAILAFCANARAEEFENETVHAFVQYFEDAADPFDEVDEPAAVARLSDENVVPAQYEAASDFTPPAEPVFSPQAAPIFSPRHEFDTPTLHRDSDPSFGGWLVTGSWLQFMPSVDDTYFAIESAVSSSFPVGTRVNNDFNFQSGFQVGAGYQFVRDRRTLQLNYTSLDAEASRTVAGDFLWATVGRADLASAFENYSGTAASNLDFSFRRIDGSFSQPWRVYDDDIYFHYGFEYADFDLSERQTFVSTTTTGLVSETSSTVGGGPEFGIGIDHALWPINRWMPGTIALDMRTTASLLIAQSNGQVQNVLAGNPLLDVFEDNSLRLIPALHARLAFNYELCSAKRQTTFTVGYQFDSYIRALARVAFPDDVADSLSTTRYDNFDLHGFFASATVAF